MKLFISRELSSESPFFSLFPGDDIQIIGESLVAFEGIEFSQIPEAHWYFFTSRNAVKFFFQGLKKSCLRLPATIKLGVLGEGTAKALKEEGYVADFAGNGEPQAVGAAFGVIAKGHRVCFPRAAQSRESIQKIISETVTILDLVVYTNTPRIDFDLPKAQILVFTSPLNAQAYFAKYTLWEDQWVLAIGQSTAIALQGLGVQRVQIAPTPSEEVLAEMCKTLMMV